MEAQRLSKDIFILDGVRTPIGSPYKGLRDFSAAQLAAIVIKEILKRAHIKPEWVSEVIFGNVVSAGTGQNLARQAAFLASLPVSTSAYLVNNVCGAGLQSVILAARSILAGQGEVIVAGGVESISMSPVLLLPGYHESFPDPKKKVESNVYDGLLCQLTTKRMGDLCEDMALINRITRQQQDQYALESHHKFCRAQEQGRFSKEIVPCIDGKSRFFEEDERPRKNLKIEDLVKLLPAFRPNGALTAGNSAVPSDGAAAAVVAGRNFVEEHHLKPQARIVGYLTLGVDPLDVFSAGVTAIERCLQGCRLKLEDIDLFEISEAFAAQVILTENKLRVPKQKINIYGGDIALGHPLGAAGMRMLVTLMYQLHEQRKKRGLTCICFGGGGATVIVIERVD